MRRRFCTFTPFLQYPLHTRDPLIYFLLFLLGKLRYVATHPVKDGPKRIKNLVSKGLPFHNTIVESKYESFGTLCNNSFLLAK